MIGYIVIYISFVIAILLVRHPRRKITPCVSPESISRIIQEEAENAVDVISWNRIVLLPKDHAIPRPPPIPEIPGRASLTIEQMRAIREYAINNNISDWMEAKTAYLKINQIKESHA